MLNLIDYLRNEKRRIGGIAPREYSIIKLKDDKREYSVNTVFEPLKGLFDSVECCEIDECGTACSPMKIVNIGEIEKIIEY